MASSVGSLYAQYKAEDLADVLYSEPVGCGDSAQ